MRETRICRRTPRREDAMRKPRRWRSRALIAAAVAAGCTAGAALAGSWDEKVFSSHVDFDAVAAAGASALPGLIARGRELFKAKFTTEDGAGRPKATQAIVPTKRKFGVNPPSREPAARTPIPAPAATTTPSSAAPAISSPTSSSPKDLKAHSSIQPTPRFRASAIPFRSSAAASSNFWRAR